MLTQSDLHKISSIMQTALANHPTRDELTVTLDTTLHSALKDYVTKKEFKKESNSVQRKLNIIISFFDKEYLQLEERVQRFMKPFHGLCCRESISSTQLQVNAIGFNNQPLPC